MLMRVVYEWISVTKAEHGACGVGPGWPRVRHPQKAFIWVHYEVIAGLDTTPI